MLCLMNLYDGKCIRCLVSESSRVNRLDSRSSKDNDRSVRTARRFAVNCKKRRVGSTGCATTRGSEVVPALKTKTPAFRSGSGPGRRLKPWRTGGGKKVQSARQA